MPARRPAALLAVLAALAAAPGCRKRVDDFDPAGPRAPENPREKCWAAFAACAPTARFDPETDVDALDVRPLVQIASRLDVPDRLASDAAARLLVLARTADADTLLAMQDAIENAGLTLGKCRCDGFPPALERQRVAEAVARRAPPRALRSPEHWAERILERQRTSQELSRRTAQLAIEGDATDEDVLAARHREAERAFCETVHEARAALGPEPFEECVELVYRKRLAESGEGSADVARRAVARHAAAPACDAAGP